MDMLLLRIILSVVRLEVPDYVVVVVDTGHQSMGFVRIVRWWSSNLEH